MALHPQRPGPLDITAQTADFTGGNDDRLPAAARRRIEDHPCYSSQAHRHFARMHVAVAPSCNIQCHYCNRRYDCANESRPGVTSEVLTPRQAVRKVLAVGARIPELAVVGIAGPGDPLANPRRTFATFQALSDQAPDLKLCLSTNGLALPRYIDALARHNIGHVTLTINCLDPEIGARIYPWIVWKGRRIHGRQASAILIEQQQTGLEMLVERGILVKINSVLIPGINDRHLAQVHRVVKERGAFMHNIVPLIARPEHDTHYARCGQREPGAGELQAVRESCGSALKLMRHCRQCRADAVGFLHQDRHHEFTVEKVAALDLDPQAALRQRRRVHAAIHRKRQQPQAAGPVAPAPPRPPPARPVRIAVGSRDGSLIDEHFGQLREFRIYEVSAEAVRYIGRRFTTPYCSGPATCGDAEPALARTLRVLRDCKALLCAKVGYEPWGPLEAAGIQPNSEHAGRPIAEALAAVYRELAAAGKLDEEPARQARA